MRLFDFQTGLELPEGTAEDLAPPPALHYPDIARVMGDGVRVVHLGKVTVYDCPQDLHAAVLVACAAELHAARRPARRRAVAAYRAALRRAIVTGLGAAVWGLGVAALFIVAFRG